VTRLSVFLFLFGALAAGCVAPVRMTAVPEVAACRAAKTLTGEPAAMRWVAPAGGLARTDLDAWCAAVGPAVVHSTSGSGAGDLAADEVLVVSWNAHVGGGDLRRLFADLRAPGAKPRHVVLLLQEVFRTGGSVPTLDGTTGHVPSRIAPMPPAGPRQDILTVVSDLGLSLVYVPSMRNGSGTEDRGSAIVSTLPLSDVAAIELPLERQRRVTVAATVNGRTISGRDWRFQVASVHLENRAGARRFWLLAPGGRTKQARALLSALPAGEPGIVGGDLNTWFGSKEGAWEALHRAYGSVREHQDKPTFARPALKLDHLFFRLPPGWRATYRRLDDTYGSDHYPLVATVSIG
jgi:endonuclease/exonuclease/phosphatase family metal-dependent hydrolase